MLANYTLTPCVNRCRPAFLLVVILIQKRTDSRLIRTRPIALKTWSCLNFNEKDHIVRSKASMQEADRRKFIASVSMDFFPLQHCVRSNGLLLILLALSKRTSFSHWRGYRTWSPEERAWCFSWRYIQEKTSPSSKRGSVGGGDCKWQLLMLNKMSEKFSYRRSLPDYQLLWEIEQGKFFGYFRCDIEVIEHSRSKIANFFPMSKNVLVSKKDIGDLMKNYAEEEKLMSWPRKTLILSVT